MSSSHAAPGADPETARAQLTWGFALLFLPGAALTWGLHEYAHWQTGRWLGYRMWISLNQAGLKEGSYDSVGDQLLVALAGPLVTYLQAALAFVAIRRWSARWAYPFLFLALWTRALAMAVGVNNPNDEATVSALLGLSQWLLPGVVVLLLLVLTILASRRLRVGWKGNAVAYAMCSLVTAVIVFTDQSGLVSKS